MKSICTLSLQLMRRAIAIVGIAGLLLALTGCSSMSEVRRAQTGSVVEFLFGKSDFPLQEERIPRLNLPMRVGIAFVPNSHSRYGADDLSATDREALMTQVADAFRDLRSVDEIVTIPATYLRPTGGFGNLDQLRRMLGIDVVVLLGFDQVQVTDATMASLAVLTIVGAFVIPTESRGTHTLLEATVYDIQSRNLLFRAAGASRLESRIGTAVALDRELREDRFKGFEMATEELIQNLDISLKAFEVRVRERPDEYEVVRRPGYTGGGSLGFWALLAPLALLGAATRFRL